MCLNIINKAILSGANSELQPKLYQLKNIILTQGRLNLVDLCIASLCQNKVFTQNNVAMIDELPDELKEKLNGYLNSHIHLSEKYTE